MKILKQILTNFCFNLVHMHQGKQRGFTPARPPDVLDHRANHKGEPTSTTWSRWSLLSKVIALLDLVGRRVWQGHLFTMHRPYRWNVLHNGYMSPEYAMKGAFLVKSDICSFGVLLLEIVSGLKISSPHVIMDFSNLIVYVSLHPPKQVQLLTVISSILVYSKKIISLFRHGTCGRMAKQRICWTNLLKTIVISMKFHDAST